MDFNRFLQTLTGILLLMLAFWCLQLQSRQAALEENQVEICKMLDGNTINTINTGEEIRLITCKLALESLPPPHCLVQSEGRERLFKAPPSLSVISPAFPPYCAFSSYAVIMIV